MFQPVIPLPGLAGWQFLQRTYDAQFDAFSKSTQLQRNTEYFRENIGKISSAEDLVSDRRLLTVALGAFGLEEDINNRYFIRKILEEGTLNEDALANRFADSRYQELAAAFGLGPGETPRMGLPGFADGIIDRFEAAQFEAAAGAQNAAVRVALYADRKLSDTALADMSNDAKWFTVLGDPPLRALFERALNLPEAIGQIDIDQQLQIFKDRARVVFGSDRMQDFADETPQQELITKYILRDQLAGFGGGLSAGSIALSLLQG